MVNIYPISRLDRSSQPIPFNFWGAEKIFIDVWLLCNGILLARRTHGEASFIVHRQFLSGQDRCGIIVGFWVDDYCSSPPFLVWACDNHIGMFPLAMNIHKVGLPQTHNAMIPISSGRNLLLYRMVCSIRYSYDFSVRNSIILCRSLWQNWSGNRFLEK